MARHQRDLIENAILFSPVNKRNTMVLKIKIIAILYGYSNLPENVLSVVLIYDYDLVGNM